MIGNLRWRRLFSIVPVTLLALGLSATEAGADHSWGNSHWARTSTPFTLKLGDNLSSVWKPYLGTTSTDWSKSSVLDTTIVPGSTRSRNCRPTTGRIEVCNHTYGQNGWIGVARIWVSGSHITAGTTRLNDTYFNTGSYNTPAWRNLVMCQEVGHTFGLDHQDENFDNANLGTCMDYTNNPDSNQHPNQHDYEQLEVIYAHLDSTTTVGAATATAAASSVQGQEGWGRAIRSDSRGRPMLFVNGLGTGRSVTTFVIWA